jgi:hypothetical protein
MAMRDVARRKRRYVGFRGLRMSSSWFRDCWNEEFDPLKWTASWAWSSLPASVSGKHSMAGFEAKESKDL